MAESKFLLEMFDANFMQQSTLAPVRQATPPQAQGRSLTDLSHASPQQRGYQPFDGFLQNGGYFSATPNTCEYRPMDFKAPLVTDRPTTRPNTVQYPSNAMQTGNAYGLEFAGNGTMKTIQPGLLAQFGIDRAPNVTITAPECNIQDLRTSIATSSRSESSPKYPFLSPMSPTVNWSNSPAPIQSNGSLDSVGQISIQNYNLQSSQQQFFNMTRQFLNHQEQQHHQLEQQQQQQQQQHQQQQQQQHQQQNRSNGFPPQYYSNEQMLQSAHLG